VLGGKGSMGCSLGGKTRPPQAGQLAQHLEVVPHATMQCPEMLRQLRGVGMEMSCACMGTRCEKK